MILYVGLFALFLFIVIRWLVRYSTDPRSMNSSPEWSMQGLWAIPAPDSTVGAYHRQVQEHARLNDEHAGRLPVTTTERETERQEVRTETRDDG